MPTAEVSKIINNLTSKLRKNNFSFSEVYLFGSYAQGRQNNFSDIDVAIISQEMKSNYEQKLDFLHKIGFSVSDQLDIHAFTPEDFAVGYPPLANEVKKSGYRIV